MKFPLECFFFYLLTWFLQNLEAVLDEFGEIGELDFILLLWFRIKDEQQLPQDAQIQLCPLHIKHLGTKKQTNNFSILHFKTLGGDIAY